MDKTRSSVTHRKNDPHPLFCNTNPEVINRLDSGTRPWSVLRNLGPEPKKGICFCRTCSTTRRPWVGTVGSGELVRSCVENATDHFRPSAQRSAAVCSGPPLGFATHICVENAADRFVYKTLGCLQRCRRSADVSGREPWWRENECRSFTYRILEK